jgi:hypothetical protein
MFNRGGSARNIEPRRVPTGRDAAPRPPPLPHPGWRGGRVNKAGNKAAREWLDTLTAPEPGEAVPSQDEYDPRNLYGGRTTTETVLRDAGAAYLVCCQLACVSPLHLLA